VTGAWFKKAGEGSIPLVIQVDSADMMATLLKLKYEVEDRRGTTMRMVFAGASEAHLLAEEIAKQKVGVILNPARPFPMTWDSKRILAGPPLTKDTALVKLLEKGVVVGLGVGEARWAVNARFDMAWALEESAGRISRRQAYALTSTALEKLLGVGNLGGDGDLVAFVGGSAFTFSSKAAAILSPGRGVVDLL